MSTCRLTNRTLRSPNGERREHPAGEEIPGRRAEDFTADMVERALEEVCGLVRARLPERFYRSEGHWRLLGTALIARIAGIGESISALVHARRQADTQILVRALYEHVLTYCWIAIDPSNRVYKWRGHAVAQSKRLHNDAAILKIDTPARRLDRSVHRASPSSSRSLRHQSKRHHGGGSR